MVIHEILIEIFYLRHIEDRKLMRAILGAPEGSPNELLYLELGCIPIKQIITCRRLNFLRDILAKNENDILHKFF